MQFRITSILAVVTVLAPFAMAAVTPGISLDERQILKRQSLSGPVTTYGGNTQGGDCSFSTYTLPSGLSGVALASSDWATSANCGGCVAVSYGGKTVTAMITDKCPSCGTHGLDLYPDAFKQLFGQTSGVFQSSWSYVPCPDISGNLQIHMKSGVSQYYFAAQVVNAKRRTDKLEYSIDQGKTWKSTVRQDYNFFNVANNGGAGASTAWIRVTSHVGTQVVVKNVPMTSDAKVTATANYS